MRYTKKPVTIEAFQITKKTRASNTSWPQWMHQAWNEEAQVEGSLYPADYPNSDGTDRLMVGTLEGSMTVDWGDFLIRGIKGELYPCKPDIFAASYEPESLSDETLDLSLNALFENACRDDCLDNMVPSDLRSIISLAQRQAKEILSLRAQIST